MITARSTVLSCSIKNWSMSFDTMFLFALISHFYHVSADQVQLVQLVHLDLLELQISFLSELAKNLPNVTKDFPEKRIIGEQFFAWVDVLDDFHFALMIVFQHLIFVDFTFFNSFELAA